MMEETELCFPQLHNFSCRRQKRIYADAVIMYVILSLISLLTATLNLLVIISISHFKQLHTPTNLLLLSLAVSDFFVGLLMSFLIILTDGCWFLGDRACALYGTLSYINTSAAAGTMVLISIDRYIAICDPLHYPNKVTVRRVSVCNVLCWLFSGLYITFILKDVFREPGKYNSCSGECIITLNHLVGIIDFVLSVIGPITAIIILYLRVFVVALSQARAMRFHIAAVTPKRPQTVIVKRSEMKAARTLGVIVGAFLTCLLPYYCSFLKDQDINPGTTSLPLEIWLFHFNSCLNPLIYSFCYPWFRKSLNLIVTLKIVKHGSCHANML